MNTTRPRGGVNAMSQRGPSAAWMQVGDEMGEEAKGGRREGKHGLLRSFAPICNNDSTGMF